MLNMALSLLEDILICSVSYMELITGVILDACEVELWVKFLFL